MSGLAAPMAHGAPPEESAPSPVPKSPATVADGRTPGRVRLAPGARRVGLAAAALLAAQALLPGAVAGQEAATPLFEARDAWVAAAYLGGTALALGFDRGIDGAVRDPELRTTPGLRPAARGFALLGAPGTLVISGGLYGIGRIGGNEDMADVGLHMGEAIVVAEVVTYAIKFLAGRARPTTDRGEPFDFAPGRGLSRGEPFRSFPSGHTAAAFAVAAVAAHEIERLRGEEDFLIALVTYGPAALVGASRVFERRHWASDVVLGAGIGAFAGWKVVRYSHTHPDNRMDDWFLAGSVVPGDWSTLRLALLPAAGSVR